MNSEVKEILVEELNKLKEPGYSWAIAFGARNRDIPEPFNLAAFNYARSMEFVYMEHKYLATGITRIGEDWLFKVEHPVRAWCKSQLWKTPMIPTAIAIVALGVSIIALAD